MYKSVVLISRIDRTSDMHTVLQIQKIRHYTFWCLTKMQNTGKEVLIK